MYVNTFTSSGCLSDSLCKEFLKNSFIFSLVKAVFGRLYKVKCL